MATCLRCGAPAGDDSLTCPDCGADLMPAGTIFPSRRVGSKSTGRPRGVAAPIAVATAPAPVAPVAVARVPGGLRGRLIRWLGGGPERPVPAPIRRPEPPVRPATDPLIAIPENGFGRPGRQEPDDEDDGSRTIANYGINLEELKMPDSSFALEILDARGHWRTWGPIPLRGLSVGRSKGNADYPVLNCLASKHMRFSYGGGGVLVEDLGTLNGVYQKLTRPVGLDDGRRFRIGGQVLEFRQAGPFEEEPPLHSEDGEEFCSRDLAPLAHIDLIRPGNRPGLRFPITRHDATVLGREGPRVTVALPNDPMVSGQHAQVRLDGDRFVLEDLKSRNGTFLQLVGPTPLHPGDVLLVGRVLFRISDAKGG